MSILLVDLENVYSGEIVKRPSQQCKTPYVADVQLQDGSTILGHSPSLGCCGLADKGATVLMTRSKQNNTNKPTVCSHRIDLAIYKEHDREIIIGINPKIGETIAEEALKLNCIHNLQNVKSFTREVKIMNSRFDFVWN